MERITEIINDWDPIGLFPMAPKDEYISEVKKIYKYMHSSHNVEIKKLAHTINKIFAETFGADIYNEDIEKCRVVAEKLLNTQI